MNRAVNPTAGVTLNAVDAIIGEQQTFTREQVAYLMSLAFESGRATAYELDVAELHMSWLDREQQRATYEQRVAQRLAEMEAGARREAARPVRAILGPLANCDWPPVAIPGQPSRYTPATVAKPTERRHLRSIPGGRVA